MVNGKILPVTYDSDMDTNKIHGSL